MSQWEHYFHIVWTTKWRQPFLTSEKEEIVFRCALQFAQEAKCEVLAVNGTTDHVHLLLRAGPQIDFSALMKKIKGTTSALLSDITNHKELFRWQEGYFSATVTPSHVRKYKPMFKTKRNITAMEPLIPSGSVQKKSETRQATFKDTASERRPFFMRVRPVPGFARGVSC